MESKPLISIIIPTFNRSEKLQRLLDSISKSTLALEIIVVNDGKEQLSLNNKIIVIHNKQTMGLAYSRTKGATQAKGKYVLFIDDDNILPADSIDKMVETLNKEPKIVAVGPLTYYYTNKKRIWFLGMKMNLTTTKPQFFRSFTNQDLYHDNLFLTDNLHNCFMVRKVSGEQVGWFDQSVFMNGTEFDTFMRIRQHHPDVLLATNVLADNYHDMPEPSKDLLRSLGFENKRRVYYFQRNRGLFVARYGKWYQKLLLGFVFYPLFLIGYGILFIIKGKFNFFITHVQATIAGYIKLVSKGK